MDYKEIFKLNKKVAFITGGAGLIGREISLALSFAGAHVVIIDVDKYSGETLTESIRKNGCTASFENIDICQPENIDSQIDKLVNKYNAIDVWVNNAYPRTQDWGVTVEELNLESWRRNIDMHLNSYSWISRKVCMYMKERASGSLINMGSIYGILGNDFSVYEGTDMTSPMAYSAIKGGIINLSRYLASYFGRYNIRVNTVCPGGILNYQPDQFVEKYSSKVPMKRMGKPEEVATAVLFLATEAASYINGATLVVDGGWSII